METQPSEASLNNARRILAQIENLRDTTGAPTLRKMWTDGTISYEFTVDEAHSRIRVWGEDLSFTGFLFTYPETGFWGVGYKKETPKYKKRPPPKILAGELDWQGIGGKLSWHGLSRYFQYTNGGVGSFNEGTSFLPTGYTQRPDLIGSTNEHFNYNDFAPDKAPYIFKDGKELCHIALLYPEYAKITCAVISPDKKKILIGYARATLIAGAVVSYSEEFMMLPMASATGALSTSDPSIIKTLSIVGHEVAGPEDLIYHPATTFTDLEATYLKGLATVMWRVNASGSTGYTERRATRQQLDITWDDDAEDIIITALGAAYVATTKHATPKPNLPAEFYPAGSSYACSFCDFDWDTLVEGQISDVVDAVIVNVTLPPYVNWVGVWWMPIAFTWALTHTTTVTIGGVVRHQTETKISDVWTKEGPPETSSEVFANLWGRSRHILSGERSFFHWVDLRVDSLSVDIQECDPYTEVTDVGANGLYFPAIAPTGRTKNVTVLRGLVVADTPSEVVTFGPRTFVEGVELVPTANAAAWWDLGGIPARSDPEFFTTVETYDKQILVGGRTPQALPYGSMTFLNPSVRVGAAYSASPYCHQSGLGVAETGIKVYYLSPTEKRCVWGIANLPSIHLNEVQTYTYGSDDPATAEQLKGVGADGLLLNIYVV
jgi:hypothetical protein